MAHNSLDSPRKLIAPIVISAHENADFDALAAMVAAGKLYPNAVLIFPGSQTASLRHFFIDSAMYLFNFRQLRDVDIHSIKTLVLVDTRQRARIPHLHAILEESSNLEIHAYDHHPASSDDLRVQKLVVEDCGAVTSMLVRMLQEKHLVITPDEATLLGLGIFEDTGSLTFSSTTEQDFLSCAHLRACGMDLQVVAELMNRDLTRSQLMLLNELLESAQVHEIHGIPIVIAQISVDDYVYDFALLVQKMMDIENVKALFAFGRMKDRIHLVARSRTNDVDAGKICALLGGGGHNYAASASIKDKTLSQCIDELFAILYSSIKQRSFVHNYMSKHVLFIEEKDTIAMAASVMQRFGFKALPVVKENTKFCVGYLEFQTAARAIALKLESALVREYMNSRVQFVHQDDDLYTVMDIIVRQRQRLVPVIDEQKNVIGVITRTDLINTLVEEPARIPEPLDADKKRSRNVRNMMQERLPKDYWLYLQKIGVLADTLQMSVYVVGGFVRDLLLYRANCDIDIVVESDGMAFAEALAKIFSGRVYQHLKFKTALVIFTDKNGKEQRIDIATARLEYYEYPAALPTVELSSIKMDLFRRDFTINALAIALNSKQIGELIDFFGAQKDIHEKKIRVLHSLSFIEDPSRILRAIRFECRYGFTLGEQTARLIKNALERNSIEKLAKSRCLHELQAIAAEKSPRACFVRMEDFSLLKKISPFFVLTPTKEKIMENLEEILNWHHLLYLDEEVDLWALYLLALCHGAKYTEFMGVLQALDVHDKTQKDLSRLHEAVHFSLRKLYFWQKNQERPSVLYQIFARIPVEVVLYCMALSSETLRKELSMYLTRLRTVRIDINGKDLTALGLTPSPFFSQIFDAVLNAKLDGELQTVEEQLDFAKNLIDREKNIQTKIGQ